MKVEIEDQSGLRKLVHVELEAATVADERDALVNEFTQHAKLPGFRPGKAPKALIEKQHSKRIEGELRRNLISKAVEGMQEKASLELYGIVKVDDSALNFETNNFALSFEVDIKPEVKLPEYKGIEFKAETVKITKKDIDEELNNLLDQRADYKVVEKAAKKGDYVKLSYEGKLDGKAVAELVTDKPIYGSQTNTWEEAGEDKGIGIKAITEGIVGKKAGDKFEVTMDFAKDLDIKALAGKSVVYSIEVHEVRTKILPKLDEKLLKDMHVDSEDALRERIEAQLKQRKQHESNSKKRETVLNFLNDKTQFELPESGIAEHTNRIIQRTVQHMFGQGVDRSILEEQHEEIVKRANEAARRELKDQLVLEAIAKAESIAIDDQDMYQRIMQEAMMTRMNPEEIVKELKKDRSKVDALRQSALFNKVLDFIEQAMNVVEK